MRVFVTGASGWIGSAVTGELLGAGHEVVGLARSDVSAATLAAAGAVVRRGDLDDLGSLRSGAADSDAVIHLANKHDFNDPAVSNRAERGAVEAIGEVLKGSERAFVVASGVPGVQGRVATEADPSPNIGPDSRRGGSEHLALEYAERGVRTVIVRFPPTVHGSGDHGFVSTLVDIARATGRSGYVGDGSNRWPAVHRSDAAHVVRLGLEQAAAGTVLHAMAELGVPTRAIAEEIGAGLGLPVESIAAEQTAAQFGWLGAFFALDVPSSSDVTRRLLGWSPAGPTLVEDLRGGAYFRR